MKTFLRILIYTLLAIIISLMIWLMHLDVDLYDTKITPETIKILNTSNGKYLFLKTWRVAKNSYYEPNMNGQDWEYWKNRYLDKIKTQDDAILAINTMLSSLNDPYSIFLNKKEFEEQLSSIDSKINGIGVHITFESGKIIIFSVVEGSPAEKAGLKSDDIIIKIDEKDSQGLNIQTVASYIRGERGTPVKITVLRDNKKIEKTIIRDEIKIDNISFKMIDDYAYIKINTFIAETLIDEFDEAVEMANKNNAKGYILDLRGNTGGLLGNALYIANAFLEKGDIVQIVNRKGSKKILTAKQNSNAIKEPVVILTNSLSASASEILCGALKDNNRAILVGEKTFGKGLVQRVFSMPHMTGMNLTISKYLTPNSTNIHKIGIKPDYEVKYTLKDYKSKKDKQLETALKVIKNI